MIIHDDVLEYNSLFDQLHSIPWMPYTGVNNIQKHDPKSKDIAKQVLRILQATTVN